LEKLHYLAEKVLQDAKLTDSKLDDLESWILEESKRIDQMHPKEAKLVCDKVSLIKMFHVDFSSVINSMNLKQIWTRFIN